MCQSVSEATSIQTMLLSGGQSERSMRRPPSSSLKEALPLMFPSFVVVMWVLVPSFSSETRTIMPSFSKIASTQFLSIGCTKTIDLVISPLLSVMCRETTSSVW